MDKSAGTLFSLTIIQLLNRMPKKLTKKQNKLFEFGCVTLSLTCLITYFQSVMITSRKDPLHADTTHLTAAANESLMHDMYNYRK